MSDKEKLLIIGALDELLIGGLGSREQFAEEERNFVEEKYHEVFDTNSPKDIREGMTALARKLYTEIKEDA